MSRNYNLAVLPRKTRLREADSASHVHRELIPEVQGLSIQKEACVIDCWRLSGICELYDSLFVQTGPLAQ